MLHSWAKALLIPLGFLLVLPACDNGSPTEPTPPTCTFEVSPLTLTVQASGGNATITVTTQSGCTWTGTSNAPWITVTSGASGSGSGTVAIAVASNPAAEPRTGTLTVAGQTVTVQEAGLSACTLVINPDDEGFGHEAATGSFTVTAPDHCAWTAVSSESWLRVISGQGTGNGEVTYSVERNDSTLERMATITVDGQVFRLFQAGDTSRCQYSVAPIEFTPCMPAVTLMAAVTTQQGCPWTAAAGAPWLSVESAASNTGSGQVAFRVEENYDAPRQGVVEIRWPTPTAGQNLQVRQAGCVYGVSTDSLSFASAGGTGQFDVVQQSIPLECGGATQDRCIWSAQADVPWITITTSMPRIGDDRVTFTVAPNTTGSARTGTITVRDKVVRVTQAG